MNDKITFSFGKNWRSFVGTVSDESIRLARNDIQDWLGKDGVAGKRILDIGCGSGIHSFVFHSLGASELVSFDADPKSVESTEIMHRSANAPENWRVLRGSVLDRQFVEKLCAAKFDVVYAWGVLHHTGELWNAMENASSLVRKGGVFWIALYAKGPGYERDLAKKMRYNKSGFVGKKMMIGHDVFLAMRYNWRQGRNPFLWNVKKERGMDIYHDIVDWLGGLPYEVANVEEVETFMAGKRFERKRIEVHPEGWNNIYLYSFPD